MARVRIPTNSMSWFFEDFQFPASKTISCVFRLFIPGGRAAIDPQKPFDVRVHCETSGSPGGDSTPEHEVVLGVDVGRSPVPKVPKNQTPYRVRPGRVYNLPVLVVEPIPRRWLEKRFEPVLYITLARFGDSPHDTFRGKLVVQSVTGGFEIPSFG